MKTKLLVPNKELLLPSPELIGLYLEIGAWDKWGKLFHRERIRSRSPVRQFLDIILSQAREGNVSVTDTSGNSKSIDYDGVSTKMGFYAALDNANYGIVVGTDATAVDMTQYQLVAKIANGTSSGQLVHNAVAVSSTITVSDPDATFTVSRNLNNNSGGSITVRETGLYAVSKDTVGAIYLMVVRDVPTAVAVPDGGGCYVLYTLKITE